MVLQVVSAVQATHAPKRYSTATLQEIVLRMADSEDLATRKCSHAIFDSNSPQPYNEFRSLRRASRNSRSDRKQCERVLST